MDHVPIESILRYISDKISEKDAFILETHLADCDECAEKVFRYDYIRKNFSEVWNSLSVDHAIMELIELQLLESLIDAKIKPDLIQRIQSWVKDFYQKTQIVMGIMWNASQKTAEIIHEELADLIQRGQIQVFAPVGKPARVLGAVSEEETRDRIQQIRKVGPNGEIIDIFYSDETIQFKIKPITFKSPAPLLWLFPVKEGTSVVKETYRPAETDYLVAEISTSELKDLSHYLIFLEYQETRSD